MKAKFALKALVETRYWVKEVCTVCRRDKVMEKPNVLRLKNNVSVAVLLSPDVDKDMSKPNWIKTLTQLFGSFLAQFVPAAHVSDNTKIRHA